MVRILQYTLHQWRGYAPTTSLHSPYHVTSSPEPHTRQRKLFLPPQPHHFVCCMRITTVVPKCLRLPLSAPSPGAQENLYITSTTRSDNTSRTPATSTLRVRDGTWERACANGVQQIFVSAEYGPGGLHRTRIVFELKRTRAFHRAYPRCALCWTFSISLSQLDLTTVGTPLCRNEGLLVILDASMDGPNDSKNRWVADTICLRVKLSFWRASILPSEEAMKQ